MLFSTPSHFLVLGLLAFGFWLVGLATHSGGRKWREMYDQEAEDFSSFRTDSDDKARAATGRITELEREAAGFERERAESAAAIADRKGNVYVSTDTGRSWSRRANGLPPPSSVLIV